MGDVSSEPTMEEILSSIKRVIEDSESAPIRRSRPARTIPDQPTREEILELSQRVPFANAPAVELHREPEPEPDIAPPDFEQAEPVRSAASARPETIVSPVAAEASRGSLEALSRMIVKPDVAGGDTLEGMVREMLRPMLREWLDAKLPDIVETMVAKEIARISGR